MPSIRTKFIAEGEKEYKEALKSIDNGMKVLQSESKKLAAQFEDNADSAEALNAKNKNLDESVLNLKDKLELQEEWLKKVGAAYGEADERTMRMKKAVNDTETALIKAEKELKNNTEALKEYGDGADNAGDNSKGLGDALDELGSKFGISLPDNIKGTLDGMVKIDGQSMALIGTFAAGSRRDSGGRKSAYRLDGAAGRMGQRNRERFISAWHVHRIISAARLCHAVRGLLDGSG